MKPLKPLKLNYLLGKAEVYTTYRLTLVDVLFNYALHLLGIDREKIKSRIYKRETK
ncbi:hypothetical protein ALT785_460026 [Alteromonas infernus]